MSLFSQSTSLAPLTPLTGETYKAPDTTSLYIFMFFFFLICAGVFVVSYLGQSKEDRSKWFGTDLPVS